MFDGCWDPRKFVSQVLMTGDAGGVHFFRHVSGAFEILIDGHLLKLPRKTNELQFQVIEDFVVSFSVRSYFGRAERRQHECLSTMCDLLEILRDQAFEDSL